MVGWSKDKIAALSNAEIKSLRENAGQKGRQDIIDICDEELTRRRPVRTKKTIGTTEDRKGQYVCEFHFVCPSELGITQNQDGTSWTGTWVVAERYAELGERYGAVVALHISKAESSYLQGVIKDWRKSPRQRRYTGEQLTQREEGIDFLLQTFDTPLPWKGDATGEKGYAWAPFPQ